MLCSTACTTNNRGSLYIPAVLTQDCEERRTSAVDAWEAAKAAGAASLPVVTNGDLADKIRLLRGDLAICSVDKASIRALSANR